MENTYQDREIDHFMNEFDKRMTHQDDMLGEIKLQTLKTNGRVNKHDWYFTILWWAVGVIGTLILISAGSIIRFINHITALDQKVTDINNNYNIKVNQ